MRNITAVILTSVLSSVLTIIAYNSFMGTTQKKEIVVKEFMPARQVHNLNERPYGEPNITNVSEFTDAAFRARPAVVHIKSSGDKGYNELFDLGGGASSGSGVILTEDGYILTNNHVVEGAKDVKVTLNDRRTYSAKVIGTDPSTDLAVIKIKESDLKDRKLPFLEYGNSDLVEVGQWVLAVGNPFNLTSTVTAGIVSAKGRNIDILEGTYSVESFIQTDAAVNPGNSGGALIDTEGNLVGINTAIITRSGRYEGYSFAVPVNLARKVAADIIEFGVVQRGFLGVTIKDVNNDIAEQYDLVSLDGVFIDRINENSAAGDAGLKKGDIITHVNSIKVKTSPELQEQVALFRPGQKLKVVYLREGKNFEAEVVLKNASNGTDIDAEPLSKRLNNRASLLEDLGIEARPLNDAERKRLKVKNGVIVTTIKKSSIIAKTNMDQDFIITSVNGKDITTLDDLLDAIMSANGEIVLDGFYENFSGDYSYVFEK